MAKSRRLFAALTGVILSLILFVQTGMVTQAGSDYLEDMRGGVASILNPGSTSTADIVNATAKELNLDLTSQQEEEVMGTLVMANVQNALNVRSEANEEASKVGKLYKDCGGIILERRDGWTKLQSGNIVGWASDEYLLFGEDALALANDVGRMMATINTETLRVRTGPGADTGVLGLLPKGDIVEVLSKDEDGWVCIDYEGEDGYVSEEYVVLDFQIDSGETMEEIKIREAAEAEAKRHVNYGCRYHIAAGGIDSV